MSSDAWERLSETEDDDLLDLPFDQAVARIRRDLGLGPDLGLAPGAFIAQEAASRGGAPSRAGPGPIPDPPPASRGRGTRADHRRVGPTRPGFDQGVPVPVLPGGAAGAPGARSWGRAGPGG